MHFVYYVQVLLSRLNFFGSKQTSNAENMGLKMYRDTAEAVICGLLPDSPSATASRTGGMLKFFHCLILYYGSIHGEFMHRLLLFTFFFTLNSIFSG